MVFTQQRIKKITNVLDMLGREGFNKDNQDNVNACFDWLMSRQDISVGTRSDYWQIYKRYIKWLDPELRLDYKMIYTKKRSH